MRRKISKKNFEGQSFYIGIDVHKKEWKVTILSEDHEHKSMSQPADAAVLANYLQRHFPGGHYLSVYEAGFSGFTSCRELQSLGVDSLVIHPADVPTSQKEKLQKTDKIDSRKLARSLRNKDLEGIHIPTQREEADRALIRQRFRLVKDLSRTKSRVKFLLYQFGISIPEDFTVAQTRSWSKTYTLWLENLSVREPTLRQVLDNYIGIAKQQRKELLLINRQIRALSQTEVYKANYELLLSIPGIGVTTAMMLLCQVGDISRFPSLDKLCAYVGLIPCMNSSGEKERVGKMTIRGRKELKIMLIEAAWDAIRADPALMLKFTELTKRMPGNKAITRIARKLLSRVRYVLSHKQAYEMGVIE